VAVNPERAMTDEIKPALDESEWRLIETGRWGQESALEQAVRGDLLWENERGEDGVFHTRPEADHMTALMALANAALPDSHPQKITRRHLRVLDQLIKEHYGEPMLIGYQEFMRDAKRLRAALAALLPPEGR
jgi:hypothetical protein